MTAIRERIITTIKAALVSAAATFPGGAATVFRAPRTAIEEETAPAVYLFAGGMRNTEGATGAERRAMGIDLEIMVSAASDELLDTAISEAHAWAASTMLALIESAAFTGWADDIREIEMSDPEPLGEASAAPTAVFGISFEVFFETAELDPSTRP